MKPETKVDVASPLTVEPAAGTWVFSVSAELNISAVFGFQYDPRQHLQRVLFRRGWLWATEEGARLKLASLLQKILDALPDET